MVLTYNNSFTDVPGILVGHAHDPDALTGCTVVLCPQGATGGVDQRGFAPGTRETDLLRPTHLVEKVNALVLAGGSAFGLDAAAGVMRYLEERGLGYPVGEGVVPIVPAAIIYDLALGRADVRPDAAMGYAACQAASAENPAAGNVGAGMGATVGKLLGMPRAMKAGLGSASVRLPNGLVVGALLVVNALGDVLDPASGQIVAGARGESPGQYADSLQVLASFAGGAAGPLGTSANTVIGVVATNARLNKSQATMIAQMAQDGVARCIRPAHTLYDGDTLFALATGELEANPSLVGALAAEATSRAILNAVHSATAAGGLPAAQDWNR